MVTASVCSETPVEGLGSGPKLGILRLDGQNSNSCMSPTTESQSMTPFTVVQLKIASNP